MTKETNYEQLGASASKAGLHKVLERIGLEDGAGLFAKVSPDIAGDPAFYSFVHCDGAGTKSIIPYLYFRETGSRELFKHLAQDALVMNLDDIFCLGTPSSLILANAIARNAKLIDDDSLGEIIAGYQNLVAQLSALGIEIILSGGETADCGDTVRTLVVDAVLCGRIEKKNIIDPNRIVPGDVIIGLSSAGRASYESEENSGIGSNGLTLARHALLCSSLSDKYPEILDPNTSKAVAYQGPFTVTDTLPGSTLNVGHALASPTRSFAPLLKELYQTLDSEIHAVIHNTGGGLTKVLRFGKGNRYIKDKLLPLPPIFKAIQEHGKVSWKEMYQVFNMGQRLEIYAPASLADSILAVLRKYNIDAGIVGRVEENELTPQTNTVQVVSEFGSFDYAL